SASAALGGGYGARATGEECNGPPGSVRLAAAATLGAAASRRGGGPLTLELIARGLPEHACLSVPIAVAGLGGGLPVIVVATLNARMQGRHDGFGALRLRADPHLIHA